jgi:hypothetical protein
MKRNVRRASRKPVPGAGGGHPDTTEWVFWNEVGWGMPHGVIGLVAWAALALRTVRGALGRLAGAVGSRGRGCSV